MLEESRRYQPVIVIGAPRSGTNILRNVLTEIQDVGTWPCDEINYIWRHGNRSYPSDVFPVELARPSVKAYIRRQFERLAEKRRLRVVVEKTCANSLRVGFVNEIVPTAKYVFIVRNGFDAVASAMKRWKAGVNVPYVLRKARYIPLSDVAYYASCFVGNRLHRLFSGQRRLAYWGPRLDELETFLKTHSLEEVCAIQWQQCVTFAERALSELPSDRVCRVRYEDFATAPAEETRRICDFIPCEVPPNLDDLVRNVSAASIDKGFHELGGVVDRLRPLIGATLRQYGYS